MCSFNTKRVGRTVAETTRNPLTAFTYHIALSCPIFSKAAKNTLTAVSLSSSTKPPCYWAATFSGFNREDLIFREYQAHASIQFEPNEPGYSGSLRKAALILEPRASHRSDQRGSGNKVIQAASALRCTWQDTSITYRRWQPEGQRLLRMVLVTVWCIGKHPPLLRRVLIIHGTQEMESRTSWRNAAISTHLTSLQARD